MARSVMARSSAAKSVAPWALDQRRWRAEWVAGRLREFRASEPPAIDIGHRLEADRLVDVVRGRVREVGEQEAEPAARLEGGRAGGRDEVAGVPPTPQVERRVDRPEADSVGSRRADARHRDGDAVI